MSLEELQREALQLPEQERLQLAANLLKSCPQPAQPDEQDEIDAAWEDEIQRRAQEVLSGEETGTTAEDLFAKIRQERGWPTN